MKKFVLGSMLFALILFSAMAYRQKNQESLSTIELKNIEALSSGETPSGSEKHSICYKDISYDENDSRLSVTVYCGDCSEIPYTTRSNQLVCP